jgi:hypothetical protein
MLRWAAATVAAAAAWTECTKKCGAGALARETPKQMGEPRSIFQRAGLFWWERRPPHRPIFLSFYLSYYLFGL